MSDNHIINTGTFIRRKSDEIDYQPCIGVLLSDGSIKRKKLDTSGDRFHTDAKKRDEMPFNMRDFVDQLEGLGEHGLDFREAVLKHLKDSELPKKTKEIMLKALETI